MSTSYPPFPPGYPRRRTRYSFPTVDPRTGLRVEADEPIYDYTSALDDLYSIPPPAAAPPAPSPVATHSPSTTTAPEAKGEGAIEKALKVVGELPGPAGLPLRLGLPLAQGVLNLPSAGVGAIAGLGAAALGSDAYGRAAAANVEGMDLAPGESPSFLQSMRAAPGAGQVIAEAIAPERPQTAAGRIAKDVGGLVGDIALDPSSYLTAGITGAGKLAKFARGGERIVPELVPALGRVDRGLDATVDAFKLAERITPAQAGVRAGAEIIGSAPAALVYAPEVARATYERGGEAIQALQEGRPEDAIEPGISALMTGSLGALMGRGVHAEYGQLRANQAQRSRLAADAEKAAAQESNLRGQAERKLRENAGLAAAEGQPRVEEPTFVEQPFSIEERGALDIYPGDNPPAEFLPPSAPVGERPLDIPGEREFLAPDPEAAAYAEQVRLMREFRARVEADQRAEEARRLQTPDPAAAAMAEQVRLARAFHEGQLEPALAQAIGGQPGAPRLVGQGQPQPLRGIGAEDVTFSPGAAAAAAQEGVLGAPTPFRPRRLDEMGQAVQDATQAPPGPPRIAGDVPPPVRLSPAAAAAAEAPDAGQFDLPRPSIDLAAERTQVPTTDAQREAGRYQKGQAKVAGLDITLETPAGASRRPEWDPIQDHYGYFPRTKGKDKDQVDVFVRPGTPDDYDGPVFVVDQKKKDGSFDEHKVMLGYGSEAEARQAFERNYPVGDRILSVGAFENADAFKGWLKDGNKTRPVGVPPTGAERRAQPRPDAPPDRRSRIAADLGLDPEHPAVQRVAELEDEAYQDSLTGLGNRRAYERAAPSARAAASFDVAGLKWFNDSHGHEAGDALLKALGQAIREEPGIQGYRTGGDEFFLHAESPEAAGVAARNIQERLANSTITYTTPDGVDVSWTGGRVDYGIGLNQARADAALLEGRARAEAAGERAPRGERPRGLVEVPAAGRDVPDRPASPPVAPGRGHRGPRLDQNTGRTVEVLGATYNKRRAPKGQVWVRDGDKVVAKDLDRLLNVDEEGQPIYQGEESLTPEQRRLLGETARAHTTALKEMERSQPTGRVPILGGVARNSVEGFIGSPGKKAGSVLEDVSAGPIEMDLAMERDKGNPLELEIRQAVMRKDPDWQEYLETGGSLEDTSFDFGDDVQFARRPVPGQRGLEGFGEDVPTAAARRESPIQRDLFGAGTMLQPSAARVTEGREGEGGLFTQDRDAAARREAAAQTTIPTEAPRVYERERPFVDNKLPPWSGRVFGDLPPTAGRKEYEMPFDEWLSRQMLVGRLDGVEPGKPIPPYVAMRWHDRLRNALELGREVPKENLAPFPDLANVQRDPERIGAIEELQADRRAKKSGQATIPTERPEPKPKPLSAKERARIDADLKEPDDALPHGTRVRVGKREGTVTLTASNGRVLVRFPPDPTLKAGEGIGRTSPYEQFQDPGKFEVIGPPEGPEILARIPGPEGTEAQLTKGARGWHVTLMDTDAGKSYQTRIYPFDKFTREQVEAKARAELGGGGGPKDIVASARERIERREGERAAFIEQHGEHPFQAPTHSGGAIDTVIAHRSTKEPGKWQLTALAKGEPTGDIQFEKYDDMLKTAQRDFAVRLPEVEPKTEFAVRPGPLGFYSALERAAEKLPQAMKGADMLRYLSDPKRGVKADELKWTGLDEFLQARGQARVTPDEIRAFLERNRVEVREVRKGAPPGAKTRDEWAREEYDGKVYADLTPSQRSWVNEMMRTDNNSEPHRPHWNRAELQLPGGENYREIVLTLPSAPTMDNIAPDADAIAKYRDEWDALVKEADDRLGSDYWQDPAKRAERDEYDAKLDALHRKMVEETAQRIPRVRREPEFTGGHFAEPNVLAHIRLTDRIDHDGKKVLFVEEVQSDWAQRGRRKGFDTVPDRKRLQAKKAWGNVWDVTDRETGEVIGRFAGDTADEAMDGAVSHRIMRGTPPGPFVEKTEQWADLALKRVMRMAAENGYDRVAWTTGDQQAARYDLRKHFDSIQYEPPPPLARKEGWGDLTGRSSYILTGTTKDGRKVDLGAREPGELDEVVGKDLADKIRSGEGHVPDDAYGRDNPHTSLRVLSGLDLKVGGEGMRAFYDQMLPQRLARLAKKWGGKVGETRLNAMVYDRTMANDSPAHAAALGVEPVHSIDVTPAMKASVGEGFPLFAARKGGDLRERTLAAEREPMDIGGGISIANPYNYDDLRKTLEAEVGAARPLINALGDVVRQAGAALGVKPKYLGITTEGEMFAVTIGKNRIRLALPALWDEAVRRAEAETPFDKKRARIAEANKAGDRETAHRVSKTMRPGAPTEKGARTLREFARLTTLKIAHELAHMAAPRGAEHGPAFYESYRSMLTKLLAREPQMRASVERLAKTSEQAVQSLWGGARNAWDRARRDAEGRAGGDGPDVLRTGRDAGAEVPGRPGRLARDSEAGRAGPEGGVRGGADAAAGLEGGPPVRAGRAGQRKLAAFHNLTAEDLLKADKLGGFPIPSIAVTGGKVHEGYGDITLVARRGVVDPAEDPRNKLYEADAYTGRVPQVTHKVDSKAREKVFGAAPRREFGELGSYEWDEVGKGPDEMHRLLSRSPAFMAQWLRSRGVKAEPIHEPTPMRYPISGSPAMQEWLAKADDPLNIRPTDPEWKGLTEAVDRSLREHDFLEGIDREGIDSRMRGNLEESLRGHLYDEDGELLFGPANRIISDAMDARANKTRIDKGGTIDRLREAIKGEGQEEFDQWLRDRIATMYKGEFVKVGRKQVPVSLDAFVEAMRRNVGAGAEKGMTFGPGSARAVGLGKRKVNLETLRADLDRVVDERTFREYKAGQDEIQHAMMDALLPFRRIWDPHEKSYVRPPGNAFGSAWDAYDDMFRGLAKVLQKKTQTRETVASALRQHGFHDVDDDALDLAVDMVRSLRHAPTEYFEAKPERGVRFEEFAGAVIPEDSDPRVRAALEKRGLKVETYDKMRAAMVGDMPTRQEAVDRLLSEEDETLFARRKTGAARKADEPEPEKKPSSGRAKPIPPKKPAEPAPEPEVTAAGQARGGKTSGKPPDEPINLNRIAEPADVVAMESRVAAALKAKGKTDEARQYRSWTEAREQAVAAGLTEADFKRIVKEKGALTDVEIEAGRMLRETAFVDARKKAAELEKLKAAGKDTGDAERAYEAAVTRAAGVLLSTVRAGGEAGRALAIHRKMSTAMTPEEAAKWRRKLADPKSTAAQKAEAKKRLEAPVETESERLARRLARERPGVSEEFVKRLLQTDPRDSRAIATLLRSEFRPSKRSKLYELWINGLLSGPPTHLANMTGNLVTQLLRIPEKAMAGALDAIGSAVTGRPRERFVGEAYADLMGLSEGVKKGLRAMRDDWRDEFGIKDTGKLEHQFGAIGGRTGSIVRGPTRALTAEDAFFKALAATRESRSMAYRKARHEGKTGRALHERIEDILANLDDHPEIQEAMSREADYQTFTKHLGRFGRMMMAARDADPSGISSVIVPFMRTPLNIAKYTLERTPLNFLRLMAKGGNAEEYAKPVMGTLLGLTFALAAKEGLLTGGGPADQRERETLEATGWQPYSVKAGDQYISFKRIEPVAALMGFAADLVETKDENTQGDLVNKIVGSIAENLTDKTFLQGVEDLSLALSDPRRYMSQWAKSLQGSVVPAIAARAAQAIDPNVRETSALTGSAIAARLPGVSTLLEPRRRGTGEPVERKGTAFERFASPLPRSAEKGPEADLERAFVAADFTPTPPSRFSTVPRALGGRGQRVELSADDMRYLRDVDQAVTARLRKLVTDPRFQKRDPLDQKRYFENAYRQAGDEARKRLWRSSKDLRQRASNAIRGGQEPT